MAVEKEFVECLIKSVWLDRPRYEEAETVFCEILAKSHAGLKVEGKAVLSKKGTSDIEDVIGEARSMIEQSLRAVSSKPTGSHKKLERRVAELEEENAALKKRVASLEKQLASVSNKESKQEENDDDDDFDLFGSDEDEEEAEKLKQERIEAYNRKKASKPAVTARSSIILEVKPWGDDTDMKELERCVRSVEIDGLEWKGSKLVPVGYGIQKLQIICNVEDDKVGTDDLEEEIIKFEEHVQSVDIIAFNKL